MKVGGESLRVALGNNLHCFGRHADKSSLPGVVSVAAVVRNIYKGEYGSTGVRMAKVHVKRQLTSARCDCAGFSKEEC